MAEDLENEPGSAALREMEEMMGYEKEEMADSASMRKTSERSAQRRFVVTAEETPFDISYHPGRVMFYSPPRQRQRWGQSQVLPRTNWGDLFFDLFYVAATYNVSYILVDQPTPEGLLYAAGTFLPVMGFWKAKLNYDARFVYEDDLFHRTFNVAYLVVVATAVLNIRPIEYLSDAAGKESMFVFSLMLVVERLMFVILFAEVYFFGVGQKKVLQHTGRSMILYTLLPAAFYLAACIVAALEHFGEDGGEKKRNLAEDETTKAGESSYTDIPIWLILIGYIVSQVHFAVNIIFCFPGGGRHKEFTVPINIEFVMHRYGEWTMLMLGESIFSLLIVDVPNEGKDFFTTFYSGILTVTVLHWLHFFSQPKSPDGHALRRNKNAGIGWSLIQELYSFVLVSLGAAFTFFLTSFGNYERRRLAGSDSNLDVKKPAADLFCGSLALIFFCLGATNLLHVGLKEGHNRVVCERTKKKNFKGIILVILKLGNLIFTATLSQWQQEPEKLSFIGLLCVLLQMLLCVLGDRYLSHNQVHALDTSSAH